MKGILPATHFFQPQVYHPSGVSTPPLPGYPYFYCQPQYQYQPEVRQHYSENCIPQQLFQNFQNMYIEDPNSQYSPITQQQYAPTPSAYYPVYMNCQQIPSQLQPMGRQFRPSSPQPTVPRRWSPRKPSTFRPQADFKLNSNLDYEDHNAENEQNILSLLKEFEEENEELSVLVGKIAGLAVSQTGSRFLQKQLTKANPDFISFVLNEVTPLIN